METAVKELTEWLDRPDAPSRSAFAASIGVSRMNLLRYEKGLRTPRQSVMDRIVIETEGAVTANAWLGKEAADVVSTRPPAAA
jgi:transcriptional regulator with XRE-family HTH domain